MERMERFLREHSTVELSLPEALPVALSAWAAGHLALQEPEGEFSPQQLQEHAAEELGRSAIEAAVLDRTVPSPITWRLLDDQEVRPNLAKR